MVVFIKREDVSQSRVEIQGGDDCDGDKLVVKYEGERKRFKGKRLVLNSSILSLGSVAIFDSGAWGRRRRTRSVKIGWVGFGFPRFFALSHSRSHSLSHKLGDFRSMFSQVQVRAQVQV